MPQPKVTIIEEPAPKELRFRYVREGRSVGCIPGVNSTAENKTFPTIRIDNYVGEVTIVVSCVTMDWPFRPHPHSLVGRSGCKDGVCTIRAKVTETANEYQFKHLGVQCVKQNEADINEALMTRARLGFDPFGTGFEHRRNWRNIKLKAVRLAFQVYIELNGSKRILQLRPAVSDIVYDKKAVSVLNVVQISHCSGTVRGGTRIILLCEKVKREDTAVVFYQEDSSGLVVWEGCANIVLVHKQVAIVFETPPYNPPYYDPYSHQGRITVNIQLKRISDDERSISLTFEYIPEFQELPNRSSRVPRKRPKIVLPCLLQDEAESMPSPSHGYTPPVPFYFEPQGFRQQLKSEQSPGPYQEPCVEEGTSWGLHYEQLPMQEPTAHCSRQLDGDAGNLSLDVHMHSSLGPHPGVLLDPTATRSPTTSLDPRTSLGSNTSLGPTHHQMPLPTPSQDQITRDDLSLSSLLNMETNAGMQYDLSTFSIEDCENLSNSLRQMFTNE